MVGKSICSRAVKIYCQGHDCNPMLFVVSDNCKSITFSSKLDQPSKSGGGAAAVSAMNMFKMMDKKGAVETKESDVQTKHKNAIIQVRNADIFVLV